MIFTEDLDEAAKKAVRMSAILRLAREANLNVNLTSWNLYIKCIKKIISIIF